VCSHTDPQNSELTSSLVNVCAQVVQETGKADGQDIDNDKKQIHLTLEQTIIPRQQKKEKAASHEPQNSTFNQEIQSQRSRGHK